MQNLKIYNSKILIRINNDDYFLSPFFAFWQLIKAMISNFKDNLLFLLLQTWFQKKNYHLNILFHILKSSPKNSW